MHFFPAGFEIKEHVQKQEVSNSLPSLPAPPQMPLPEIPQQWLVCVNLTVHSARRKYFLTIVVITINTNN